MQAKLHRLNICRYMYSDWAGLAGDVPCMGHGVETPAVHRATLKRLQRQESRRVDE